MKNSFKKIVILATLTVSNFAYAQEKITTTQDLKLDCSATYQVLSSVTYEVPPHFRSDGYIGTAETQKVLSLQGIDCGVLEQHYNIHLKPGDVTGSNILPDNALVMHPNPERVGKIETAEVQQQFKYANQQGELPLFPILHQEFASLMGLSGEGDVAALYSAGEENDLDSFSDADKQKLLDLSLQEIAYGKNLDSYSDSEFFQLILRLNFTEPVLQQDYLQNILLVFQNITKLGDFTSFSPGVKTGEKINELLNSGVVTKWKSKLEIYKDHPSLFEDQIISWASNKNPSTAPMLNESEIEEYLIYVYDLLLKFQPIPQFVGYQVITSYKNSAMNLKKHSIHDSVNWAGPKYPLTAKSLDLIEKIINVTVN